MKTENKAHETQAGWSQGGYQHRPVSKNWEIPIQVSFILQETR